ncbi:Gamma-tubulin complex component protein [Carpediemonas membranifera]|uniref:Gamma-tubulin complex component protein n=1 Tax=Carpediemonas membranifera TaxID=201153 RepID=A0A8J6B1I8_9EUKA|nr:Gamma-tubulin complex component protein [Carpediemonas membranifera]|eukprot:KAG9393693.1 Gamma-tubulin complex component protein [Carpediemonas membranifera]
MDFSSIFEAALGIRDIRLEASNAMTQAIVSCAMSIGEDYSFIAEKTQEILTSLDEPYSGYIYAIANEMVDILTEYEDYIGEASVASFKTEKHSLMAILRHIEGSSWPEVLHMARKLLSDATSPASDDTNVLTTLYRMSLLNRPEHDAPMPRMVHRLFVAAYRVFARSLAVWLTRGELLDPTADFMVVAKDAKDEEPEEPVAAGAPKNAIKRAVAAVRSSKWFSGWGEVGSLVPAFVDKPTAQRIMTIGKTAHLIRMTGSEISMDLNGEAVTATSLEAALVTVARAGVVKAEFPHVISLLHQQVDPLLWQSLVTAGFFATFDRVAGSFLALGDTDPTVPESLSGFFSESIQGMYLTASARLLEVSNYSAALNAAASSLKELGRPHRDRAGSSSGCRGAAAADSFALDQIRRINAMLADVRAGMATLSCYFHFTTEHMVSTARGRLEACRNFEDAIKSHTVFLTNLQERLFVGSPIGVNLVEPMLRCVGQFILEVKAVASDMTMAADGVGNDSDVALDKLLRHYQSYSQHYGTLALSMATLRNEHQTTNQQLKQLHALMTFDAANNDRRKQRDVHRMVWDRSMPEQRRPEDRMPERSPNLMRRNRESR